MRRFLLFILLLAGIHQTGAAQQLSLLHQMRFGFVNTFYGPGGTTDCWGWEAPDGTEYAIVGNHNSIAFVRASDGLVCDSVSAPFLNDPFFHRDMVTYRN